MHKLKTYFFGLRRRFADEAVPQRFDVGRDRQQSGLSSLKGRRVFFQVLLTKRLGLGFELKMAGEKKIDKIWNAMLLDRTDVS